MTSAASQNSSKACFGQRRSFSTVRSSSAGFSGSSLPSSRSIEGMFTYVSVSTLSAKSNVVPGGSSPVEPDSNWMPSTTGCAWSASIA